MPSLLTRQFVRWLVVGLCTNFALYLVYLLLTRYLLGPRSAMSFVYVAGVVLGFLGNRMWTFQDVGSLKFAFTRYVGVYAIGYVINWAGLHIGIVYVEAPHEIVQAVMMVLIAASTFFMQKYFVFRNAPPAGIGSGGDPR